MRVSNRFLYTQLVKDIGRNTEKMFRLNSQISSGKRIDKPSEDPVGMSSVLIYRTELNAMDQFEKSINLANGWLARSDAIMQDIDNILGRTLELTTKAASGTETAETRKASAREIKQLREQLTGTANSKYGNKFMFGGTRTQTQPFIHVDESKWVDNVGEISAAPPAGPADGDRYINSANGNIYEYSTPASSWQDLGATEEGTAAIVDSSNEMYVYQDGTWKTQYQGNNDGFDIKIGKTDTVQVNTPGKDLFMNSSDNINTVLLELERALNQNDQEEISNKIDEIKGCSDSLSNNLAIVGARMNRLTNTKTVLQRSSVDTQNRISLIEDLDFAEALTSLMNQETIYQATLKSTSMITNLSLVDFV